jgi:hypothetical protein
MSLFWGRLFPVPAKMLQAASPAVLHHPMVPQLDDFPLKSHNRTSDILR